MSTELFRALPEPKLDTRNFEEMYEDIRTFFVGKYPDFANFVEGDPVHSALQAAAYSKLNDAQRSNQNYLQTLLAFATGDGLDIVAANLGVSRQTKIPEVLDDEGNIETPAVLETDAQFRNRACLQWAGLGAGTNGWYKRHALAASPQVKDAVALNNGAANVLIYVQSEAENGGVVATELLNEVTDYINDLRRRITNDVLTVRSIATVPWNLTAEIEYVHGEDTTARQTELEAIVREWAKTQEVIDNDIKVSRLYSVLTVDFVAGVTISSPAANITTTVGQVPVLGSLTLTEAP